MFIASAFLAISSIIVAFPPYIVASPTGLLVERLERFSTSLLSEPFVGNIGNCHVAIDYYRIFTETVMLSMAFAAIVVASYGLIYCFDRGGYADAAKDILPEKIPGPAFNIDGIPSEIDGLLFELKGISVVDESSRRRVIRKIATICPREKSEKLFNYFELEIDRILLREYLRIVA